AYFPASARVRAIRPGPISIPSSFGEGSRAATIFRWMFGSTRKFWPRDFFARWGSAGSRRGIGSGPNEHCRAVVGGHGVGGALEGEEGGENLVDGLVAAVRDEVHEGLLAGGGADWIGEAVGEEKEQVAGGGPGHRFLT